MPHVCYGTVSDIVVDGEETDKIIATTIGVGCDDTYRTGFVSRLHSFADES